MSQPASCTGTPRGSAMMRPPGTAGGGRPQPRASFVPTCGGCTGSLNQASVLTHCRHLVCQACGQRSRFGTAEAKCPACGSCPVKTLPLNDRRVPVEVMQGSKANIQEMATVFANMIGLQDKGTVQAIQRRRGLIVKEDAAILAMKQQCQREFGDLTALKQRQQALRSEMHARQQQRKQQMQPQQQARGGDFYTPPPKRGAPGGAPSATVVSGMTAERAMRSGYAPPRLMTAATTSSTDRFSDDRGSRGSTLLRKQMMT